MGKYEEVMQESLGEIDAFWTRQAEKLFWFKKWDKVLDQTREPFYRYFEGGLTNMCYNAVDRHVEAGKGNRPAIIWESPETGKSRTINYSELLGEVNAFAAVLKKLGVGKGDGVLIYLPMIPETMVAMLACARIGAIHSVVFAGFSFEAVAERIDDAGVKLVITADAGKRKGRPIPLKSIVDKALEIAENKVGKVLVVDRGITDWKRVQERDFILSEEIAEQHGAKVAPVWLPSNHPLYLMYTSGTTGRPKGVVRDTGAHMVALYCSVPFIYGCKEGDVYWATSDFGWTVGHSYIVYGPLLFGLTTVVYEGTPDYPDPGIWWKVVEKHKVNVMFSSPTAMRMLRKFPSSWFKKHDLSSLRYLFLAGEPLDEPTWRWAKDSLGKPVIDHYWQTESGWPMLSNMPGIEMLEFRPGSPTKPVYGWNMAVVDNKGDEIPRGKRGLLVVRPPLPPGTFLTLWRDDERYLDAYWRHFPDKLLFYTGDFAIEDKDGYFWVLGRADEVINVAGHRLGTREIEEIISGHPAVAEASAVGVKDELKGQAIVAFAVLKQRQEPSDEIRKSIVKLVREKIGPVATPRDVQFVKMLPKTRSGKVMRRVLIGLCEGAKLGDLTTLEDGTSVDEIKRAVENMGIK
ncbi:acetate--CoA ligase [candidate division WOR-3 bacterium JGI_Cruoil_03_51_56]|uniref:Acetate--CoA ligase n=1 Tax=candidate division WOR-3 bacterium JGI_Cruoil_03_51_56 TaxID=1973747 RepID=A0A235BR93_UNCW3|nr:MAG: acetate--CoA ligase [candidate division WOR-3 bacterium JGI_Cruoil_03_51_56]